MLKRAIPLAVAVICGFALARVTPSTAQILSYTAQATQAADHYFWHDMPATQVTCPSDESGGWAMCPTPGPGSHEADISGVWVGPDNSQQPGKGFICMRFHRVTFTGEHIAWGLPSCRHKEA